MTSPLRIVFFGSPAPAAHVLSSLIESHHEVVAVITQPDKRRGRGSTLMPTAVKEVAIKAGIVVHEPAKKADLVSVVDSLNADIGVVAAYGKILPESVLTRFRLGCINVHYSILPRWRGAAPVERAILAGDSVTGVTIMQMDEGLDTGPTYIYRQIDITPTTTTTTLFESMNVIAGDVLTLVLDSIEKEEPTPQEGEPNYADKLQPEDFFFDATTSADDLDRKIRAGSLVKGAWTNIDGEKFRILSGSISDEPAGKAGAISRDGIVTCSSGTYVCDEIQVPGKPVMEFSSWANGVVAERFPLKINS